MGGSEAASTSFIDLRRLADWFDSLKTHRAMSPVLVERVVRRLGAACVPMLGRELISPDTRRRDAARIALAQVALDIKPRVIAELRSIANGAASDESKVCALGLLAELGERSTSSAKFSDSSAIQQRSARALATELDSPADVAAAADMMIQQQSDDDIVRLLEVMVGASSGAAYHLAAELCARLDVAPDTRERIAQVALGSTVPLPVNDRRATRPIHTAVLVDATGRSDVVACRKLAGERRWRRWAVLISAHGGVDDCVHEDRAPLDVDHGPLIASLVADGYHVVTTDQDRARGIVAAAARHSASASESPDRLPTAYYLGRDLLDLGEAHLGGRVHAHPTSTTLGRAVDLIASSQTGDVARAQVLLTRCTESADALAATAACLLAQQRPAEALAPLARAIELEPDFPLHHWNHACAAHQLGDGRACYTSLRRFLTTSERPTGLYADPDQPARVSLASRMMATLERSARLTGTPLVTPPRRKKKRSAAKR
jgi:hypothetical protein